MTSTNETRTAAPQGVSRRQALAYLVAAPTLAIAIDLARPDPAGAVTAPAVVPSLPGPAEILDLTEAQTLAAAPTSMLILLTLGTDGIVRFAFPRSENGQGITTSTAMLIAEELDLPVERVDVTLADARPELLFNQLTGGSNTTHSTYLPVRTVAAAARTRLLATASARTGVAERDLRTDGGAVVLPDGTRIDYGDLAEAARVERTTAIGTRLKDVSEMRVIGRPRGRVDARAAVTGAKKYTMDLDVPGALPTMVCRPPTLNGTVRAVRNAAAVLAMPGVTHVAEIPTGVAVRAETFGQCVDAVRALEVDWADGPVAGMSDADVLAELRGAQLPLAVPKVPLLTTTVDTDFTFWFSSNSALEPNCAIADVRPGSAEIWAGLQAPIVAQGWIAGELGLPVSAVTVHVTQGGGSFGRKLFHDAASEAAQASRAMGVPVKLMWHRADDFRQGRVHPASTHRIRTTLLGGEVLTWEQRHTSIGTDFSHGFGEMLVSVASKLPVGDLSVAETIYVLTQSTHYSFGVQTNLLSEVDRRFNTGAMRNIYSPNVATARELTVDRIGKRLRLDPLQVRRRFARDERSRAVLDAVAEAGEWGRALPDGVAQGIAFHAEYQSVAACLVEIDCRPGTVGREVRDGRTGPRVTRVTTAVDVGLTVNPKGLEAQMIGGVMDGIAIILTSSVHLRDGHFLEASWDNYAYTRQWNVPPEMRVIVMENTSEQPGGAGELAVASAAAATATAYARATGTMPTEFPVNHHEPLHFEVKPTVPPVPASPVDGLRLTY